ncbi:hypothetical protein, partial [Candidatus Avelusimicrobium stercoris]|uniref:hypothetical protein n=1 Tax=Candidatus Avelusimicrobium stercoris TaxID=1947924 RepID=UPI003D0A679E
GNIFISLAKVHYVFDILHLLWGARIFLGLAQAKQWKNLPFKSGRTPSSWCAWAQKSPRLRVGF